MRRHVAFFSNPQPGSIIFVHGLRGHPQKTWEGQLLSVPAAGEARKEKGGMKKFFSFKKSRGSEERPGEPAALNSTSMVFWPSSFLGDDIPNARIFTYGYNADVVAGLFEASNKNNIYEHTTTMIAKLKRELEEHDVSHWTG